MIGATHASPLPQARSENQIDTVTLSFQPDGREVRVRRGTLISDAAQELGVDAALPCGGQGRCGRCKVRIESGEVRRRPSPHLKDEEIAQGWALACLTEALSDLQVVVPPRRVKEKAISESAAAKSEITVDLGFPKSPTVVKFYVELPPPDLEDNASDFDRLRRELSRRTGVNDLVTNLSVLRKLSTTLRDASWKVTAVLDRHDLDGPARLVDIVPGDTTAASYAVAIDIGTTTVVIYLVETVSGKVIDRASAYNAQIAAGEDVISRIVFSQRGNGLERLRQQVLKTIGELLAELATRNRIASTDINDVVVSGNTTMIHLFLGLNPKQIREEPYIPGATHLPTFTAAELDVPVNPSAGIFCVPGVAAYVGGDITAGVLSSGLFKTTALSLFMDIGTNGELVLGNSDWLITCACSAGPAFEGAGVQHGMRATVGAIEDVRINSRTLEPTIKVIGDASPMGICGSGMISALAEMFITGVVDKAGRINLQRVQELMPSRPRARVGEHGKEYVLVWKEESGTGEDIVFTEVDINNLIRTKAAIYAGITVMARSIGIDLADLEQVLIGGAFGQHINIEEAIQIGLLPDLPWEKFKFLGNTSALGSYHCLMSPQARAEVNEIAKKMTYLELIADNTFMDEYTSAMFLPHTDVETFPSVKPLITSEANH